MQSLALLLALLNAQEKLSGAEIRDWIKTLGSESIEARDEATSRLARIGERALPQLKACLESPDPEVVRRARFLVKYINLETILPKALRRHHPGVFQKLLWGRDPVWTRVFLDAAGLREIKPRELNPLSAPAVRGAGSAQEEIQVARLIKSLNLEASIPAILERLRQDEHHPPPAFARLGPGMPFDDPNESMSQRNDHHLVVGSYMEALAAMGEKEEILAFLRNDCSTYRFHAIASLAATGDRKYVAEVVLLLRDPDDWVKSRAVRALAQLGARDRWKEIAALLSDRESDVRRAAMKALSGLEATEAIPAVLALLKHRRTASHVVKTLGQLGAKDAVLEIAAHLRYRDPVVRRSAILALRELHATSAVPELMEMLRDPSPTVRRAAARTLGALGAKRAVPHLIQLLRDPNCGSTALSALGELEASETVPSMTVLLENRGRWPVSAMRALAELNARDEIATCARYLDSEDRSERRAAVWALGELGARECAVRIRRCLRDPDSSVRCAAVLALGTLKVLEAVEDLAPLLGDDNGQVRADTARTLARLEARACQGRIKALLKDKSSYVREAAAESLALLGSAEGVPVILDGGTEESDFESLNSHSCSILNSLNALKNPNGWKRIRDRKLTRNVEGPIAEALSEIAESVELEVEVPNKVLEAPWSTLVRRVRARDGRKSVLKALEEVLPNTHVFVLEGAVMRVMNREDATAYWRAWWDEIRKLRPKK